jgi:hypothetical protein
MLPESRRGNHFFMLRLDELHPGSIIPRAAQCAHHSVDAIAGITERHNAILMALKLEPEQCQRDLMEIPAAASTGFAGRHFGIASCRFNGKASNFYAQNTQR